MLHLFSSSSLYLRSTGRHGEAAPSSIIINFVLLFLIYLGFLIAIPTQFWYLSSETNPKKSKSILSKELSGSSVTLWVVGLVILDFILFLIVWYDATAYPEGSITHLLVVLLFYINLFASLFLIVLGPVYLLVLLIISWRRRKEGSARGLAKYVFYVVLYLALGPIVGSVLLSVAAFSTELVF